MTPTCFPFLAPGQRGTLALFCCLCLLTGFLWEGTKGAAPEFSHSSVLSSQPPKEERGEGK